MEINLITREGTVTRKTHQCPRIGEIVQLNGTDYQVSQVVHQTDATKVYLLGPVDAILERSGKGIQNVADYLLNEVFDHPDLTGTLYDPGVPADDFVDWHRKWGQAYYRQWCKQQVQLILEDFGDYDIYTLIDGAIPHAPPEHLVRAHTDATMADTVDRMVEQDLRDRIRRRLNDEDDAVAQAAKERGLEL